LRVVPLKSGASGMMELSAGSAKKIAFRAAKDLKEAI
jgi:hypothetical protein